MLRLREEGSQANLDKQKITTYNIAEIQTADYSGGGENDKKKTT